jgi:hypothetical protein
MHGDERVQDRMFSYVSLEQRVPVDHPLRVAFPANLVPVAMRETGMRGARYGTRKEAYAAAIWTAEPHASPATSSACAGDG